MLTTPPAEYARIPFADNSLIPIPSSNGTAPDNLASYVFTSDIFATGWQGVSFSGFEPGDTVAIFGAGPVGLLSAYSAMLRGASRVYSIDHTQSRLDIAASIGAIPINFEEGDPVAAIMAQEPGGVTRTVDCVGFEALDASLDVDSGVIIRQMIQLTAQQGGMGQIGVFSHDPDSPGVPLGSTMNTNVTIDMATFFNKGLRWQTGPVDPKVVAPELVELISSGAADPSFIISSTIGIEEAPDYYQRFDEHDESKVMLYFPGPAEQRRKRRAEGAN